MVLKAAPVKADLLYTLLQTKLRNLFAHELSSTLQSEGLLKLASWEQGLMGEHIAAAKGLPCQPERSRTTKQKGRTLLPPLLPLRAPRMSGVRVEAAAIVMLFESSMTC